MRLIARRRQPQSLYLGLTVVLCLSLLGSPLGALPPLPAQAAKQSLHPRNFASAGFFASFWRSVLSFLQPGTPNLDTLRSTTPLPPTAYAPSGTLPSSTYDDPKPTIAANYAAYLTQLSLADSQAGPAGAIPMQIADPTAGTASVGGLSIEMQTARYNFTAPVLSLPGRAGNALTLALSYGNRVWTQGNGVWAFNADRGFPAPGWHLGFGAIQVKDTVTGSYVSGTTGQSSIVYLEPSGLRHELSYNSTSGYFESYDASYLKFHVSSQVLYFPDGTRVQYGAYSYSVNNRDYQALPVEIKDRNGNYTSIYYKTLPNEKVVLDYVLDTAGRCVDFYYENNRLLWIGQQRNGTWFKYVNLDYQPVTIQTGLSAESLDPPTINGTQVWLLSRISYPTGVNFRFSYSSLGVCHTIQKWAPGISGQGSERMLAQTVFSFASGLNGRITNRSEWAENWQGGTAASYGYSYAPYDYYQQQVADPTGRQFRFRTESNTLKVFSAVYAFNGMDTVKQKEDIHTYAKDAGLSYTANLRLVNAQVESGNGHRVTAYAYTQLDGLWLPTTKDESYFNGPIYRRTVTEYTSYPAQNVLGLPAAVSVYAGPGTTLLAKTTNIYDETNSVTDSNNQQVPLFVNATAEGVIQHDNANYGGSFTKRGNLTSVIQHSVVNGAIIGSRVLGRTAYDSNGNVRAKLDAANNRQAFAYGDYCLNKPTGVGETHVVPYTVADPTGFRTGSQWNYFTGQAVKTFNLLAGSSTEQQVVTTAYDFADRPLQTTRLDGGWVRTDYWDNLLAVGTAQQIEAGKVRFKWEVADGAGRVFKKASDHPDAVSGKYAGQVFVLDKMGQTEDSSNVIAINGTWAPTAEDAQTGFLFTHLTRDALSRLNLVTFPDGNTRQYEHTGCGCAGNSETRVTDELGHATKTINDTYGRLREALEGVNQVNGFYSRAVYSYDELDRLVEIKQEAPFDQYYQTTPTQTRTFSYDGYGRLASETTPEGGTVTYTYTANDQVATKTDARGVVVTNQYNTRNLLTQVSYSGGTAPTVTYAYDAYGARQTMTDGEGQTSYSYNSYRQLESETRSFPALTGNNYTLAYSYNQADQVKSVNYLATNTVTPTNGAPATEADKDSAPGPFSISGTVSNAQGQPVANVMLATYLPGQIHPTVVYTNSQGQYVFSNLPAGGNYTITPSLAGYVFSPYPRNYNNLQSNKSNGYFTATLATPQVTTLFDKRVNYAYNNVGALNGVGTNLLGSDPNATTNVLNTTTFRASGALKSLLYGNGRQLTMGYNANRQQPISMKVDRVGNPADKIIDYTYEYYDAQGKNNNRIRSITDNVDSAYTVSYSYDDYNRLTSALAGAYWRGYGYDRFGNLKQVTGSGGPKPNYTLNYALNATTAPATNRIASVTENGVTEPFTYDAAGNLTAGDGMTYAYDGASRLSSVNGGALGQYGYDGDGMRVKKVEGSVTTYYVRSSRLGEVAFEVTGTGIQRAYLYAENRNLVAELTTDGQFYWLHNNHLGSAQAMTDTSGNLVYKGQFDPHGQTLMEWSASGNTYLNAKKFATYERDWATGLDYARARTYGSKWGRFMQPDPFSLGCGNKTPNPLRAANTTLPQSFNRYVYAWNDPMNFNDPSGLYPRCTTWRCQACQAGCAVLATGCVALCIEGVVICPICVPPCIAICIAAHLSCLRNCESFG